MRPCERVLLLFVAPLALGILIGLAVAGTVLAALEDAQRERRERLPRDIDHGGMTPTDYGATSTPERPVSVPEMYRAKVTA